MPWSFFLLLLLQNCEFGASESLYLNEETKRCDIQRYAPRRLDDFTTKSFSCVELIFADQTFANQTFAGGHRIINSPMDGKEGPKGP